MTRIQELILEALRDILLNGPRCYHLGICNAVAEYLDGNHGIDAGDSDVEDALTIATKTWPHRTNSEAYPVGNWTDYPNKLFWKHCDNRVNMWDPKTRYGKARLDLLNHLIDHFQKLDAAS